MDKLLKIYTYVDGVNDTPFPNADAQIEIFSFNYNAKRMGGAPTISTSVMYKDCLDKLWTGKEYVIYDGERYKLKQTPTSSKSNTDARYKHDLELVALRIVLDFVYFFDAVVENTPVDDKPVTNSTKVVFSGDIHEFAQRLNASLKYTKLDYSVVVDKGVTSETKFLEFTDQPISSVLQEIYKQYEIPYYFVGNVIHIGFMSNTITTPFKYGVNDALLSISKNNANNKIVNRCTGVGSSENIPYYYPNEHPLGEVDVYYNGAKDDSLIVDKDAFAKEVKLATVLLRKKYAPEELVPYQMQVYTKKTWSKWLRSMESWAVGSNDDAWAYYISEYLGWWSIPWYSDYIKNNGKFPLGNEDFDEYYIDLLSSKDHDTGVYRGYNENTEKIWFSKNNIYVDNTENAIRFKIDKNFNPIVKFNITHKFIGVDAPFGVSYKVYILKGGVQNIGSGELLKMRYYLDVTDGLDTTLMEEDFVYVVFTAGNDMPNGEFAVEIDIDIKVESIDENLFWYNEKGAIANLKDYGLAYSGTPNEGDKIEFKPVEGSLIPFQDTLMPPIYTESKGAESFYNAYNDTYISPETGTYYEFENKYSDDNRREHKETFDYIKPSIEFVRNGEVTPMPINMFLAFAYDKNDSDEIDETTNEYIHPYFYAKLRKFNGEFGFNLFDHANEKGEMTISMTSGDCGACQFVVGVEDNTKKNIVQVDENGDLVRDEYGNVKRTGEPQDRQNDTINNEVWIALKKDIQTFGTLLPNKGIKPKACTSQYKDDGDTFVITNITLPKAYIQNAEERLKEEIIKYMKLNNSEKFTFSIKFSRIYLADNPNIFAQLNENARIQIEYNGVPYELYISSYQYKVVGNEALPEITVELADSLSTNENAIQKAVSAVEHSIMSSVGSIDFYKQGLRYFIRKDVEDWARGLIHLTKGATFGADDIAKIDEQGNAEFASQVIRQFITTQRFIDGFAGEGFKIWLDENGRSNLTVDNLTAREAFRVFELVVTKLRAVNGGLFISAANGTIREVSESEDGRYFIITFEQESAFIAGDYMRCQVMSGNILANWWVEVAQVDNGRVWVAKSEFGGAMPLAGQEVVLDGSKNVGRQNAIHISASDDGQPRIEILNGIKTKSHDGCLRTRLGNLDSIYDETFGNNQPHGDGLYSDNAYLKGEFILANGKNVETMFAIQDGQIKSSISQTQAEAIKGKTLLYNASFTKGFDGWETSNDAEIYVDEQGIIVNDNKALQQSVTISDNAIFDNVFCMQINNGWIKQQNWMFINKPDFEINKTYPLFFSTNIRCTKAGELVVKVKNETIYSKQIEPTADFISLDADGLGWDGSGDFYLSFTGIAEFYGLTMYSEKTEVKYATLFEQNERLIQLSAAIYEKNEAGLKVLQESGIAVQSEGAGLYARKSDGSQALIAAYIDDNDETKILLSGDKIRLEGDISLNGKVRIDVQTGTLYAEDGSFSGKITSEEGNIGGFEISSGDLMAKSITSEDDYHTMMLSANNIHFKKYEYFDASYGGADIIYETNINARLGNNTIASTTGNFVCPLKIDVASNNQSNVNLGMYIDVTGARRSDNSIMTGNHALYIPSGDICGFRLKTRRINNSETLNKMDSLIIVTQSGITVTLPNDAEEGQMYIVKKLWGLGSYTISAQGDDKLWIYASGTKTSQLIESSIGIVLYYDAANKAWCGGQIAYI